MANLLKRWMLAATPAEKTMLARRAKTTVGSLTQAAGGYRTAGKVSVSPDLARRLELASAELQRKGLPPMHRADLCEACGRCEFAREAKKNPKE